MNRMIWLVVYFALLNILSQSVSYVNSALSSNEEVEIVSFVDVTRQAFFNHPIHDVGKGQKLELVEYLSLLSRSPQCMNKPIIMSMARVQSVLYWRLIEGFYHSMLYYDLLSCSIMICVTG